MNIQITGRHLKITEAMKEYINEKILSLEKYTKNTVNVHVLVDIQRDTHGCEINISGKDLNLNSRAESKNMYESISSSVDKMEHQMRRHRSDHGKGDRKSTKDFEKEIIDSGAYATDDSELLTE